MKNLTDRSSFLSLIFLFFASCFLFFGCAGKVLDVKNLKEIEKNDEFDKTVKIVIPEEEMGGEGKLTAPALPILTAPPAAQDQVVTAPGAKKTRKKAKSKDPAVKAEPKLVQALRQPELESTAGFEGASRRPRLDPFRIGEKVVHDVTYMKFNAGTLTLETKPLAAVNGRPNYNFKLSIRTSTMFSTFYSVDDFVTTLVDFEKLVPSVFKLSVRETKQVREAQAFFDNQKNTATFWEKRITKEEGEQNKKIEWDILEYSQNIYSAVFYLRIFEWPEGAENAFRVANDGENLVFKAKTVRREVINTSAGKFPAVVIQPEFMLQGKYKPTGDNYIWLSDDDRKFILRIESKVNIGTLVSEVSELHRGQ